MGACCGKQSSGPDAEIYERAQRSRLPDTEADRQARAAAAAAVSAAGGPSFVLPVFAAGAQLGQPRSLFHGAWTAHTRPAAPRPQAEARQQQWETSAAGRAAIKSVKAVQEERHQGRPTGNDNIKDWLT